MQSSARWSCRLHSQQSAGRRRERQIYVLTAALFVTVAVVGFTPRSVRILSGSMANPPLIVHVHAALMVAWLLLLLTQASLMRIGQRRLHQTLGLASFALAPRGAYEQRSMLI